MADQGRPGGMSERLKVQICTDAGCIEAQFDADEPSNFDILDRIEKQYEAMTGGLLFTAEETVAVLDKIREARL
jgi:hypothetical protein